MVQSVQPRNIVLVVDDETFIRMNAIDMLQDSGFGVLEAVDADDALRVLADHPEIGVLFTDINMPGSMDGLDLARRVHELRPDVHLIITSGKVRPSASEIPDSGRFIEKPYQQQQFIGLVQAAVAS